MGHTLRREQTHFLRTPTHRCSFKGYLLITECCPRLFFFFTGTNLRASILYIFFPTRSSHELAFVWIHKGNLLSPPLLCLLNHIMCHHASPTRLFPSYQQCRLPVQLNCLLCRVTAEERWWAWAVLASSCCSLSATLLRKRIHLWTVSSVFEE